MNKEQIEKDFIHLEEVLEHIRLVEKYCVLLAKKMWDEDRNFALKLVQRARNHDLSKFNILEFGFLRSPEDPNFKFAIQNHWLHNAHHPEYHLSIDLMENLDIAEMVCDWFARGNEFGTGIEEWIKNTATEKYNFKITDKVGEKILFYLNLIKKEPFKIIK